MGDTTRVEVEFTITNELGLHFRAAAMIVRTVADFESAMEIRAGEAVADAKSVLDLMTLAAARGTRVHVTAEGKDAKAAVEALGALIQRNFAE